MAIFELDGETPDFPASGRYWIADTAVVIGRVRLRTDASVWFGAVLRGDNEWIELGERSQIQDNTTLHTDPGFPITIGDNCVIGHNVVLHGCSVASNSLIGMGAIVLNGAKIGRNCLVGRRRAGDGGEGVRRQFADRGRARTRGALARRRCTGSDCPRRRHLRAALAAIRERPQADRMKHPPSGTGAVLRRAGRSASGGRADRVQICARGAAIGLREFEEMKRNQRDVAVAAAGRVSPSAIHAFASVWDCRFTKR